MRKSIVISEQDNIAALLENDRVVEFFVLHANDVPGQGPLKERLVPKQKLLVQITKEPTGHKGPRVSTAISLPGRFLVLVPEERGVSISRRISEARERARLKSVVNLMKPPGVGLIIRTEAKGQGDQELFEDFEQLWDRWQTIVSEAEASIGPTLIYRDQDLLFRVIRDAYSHEVSEIIADSPEGMRRAQEYLSGWASKQTKVSFHTDETPLLLAKGIDREIEAALSDRAELPSGGHLNVQPTEALTVIDVNSGRFTSSRTQAETVRRTNLEAAQEIPRQLRLRNIGGMVIVDFIDMDSRKDQQQVLEAFQRALEEDRAKPQIGQLSDLGLVELTRRRQGQSLRELFSIKCQSCVGQGVIPQLELGPPEDRRVIAFRNRDEENRRGRNRGKGGGQPLKAASAMGGRVVPSVQDSHTHEHALSHDSHDLDEHGHDFDDVPEEILAQMPEDLLDPRSQGKGKHINFDDHDDDIDAVPAHEDDRAHTPIRNSLTDSDDDDDSDDEQDMASDLARSVSAVESVYQEMDSHSGAQSDSNSETYSESGGEAPTTTHDFLEPVKLVGSEIGHMFESAVDFGKDIAASLLNPNYSSPSEGSHDRHETQEHHHGDVALSAPVEEPEPPIAAEVDPVTGVYRLKTKAEQEAIDRAEDERANSLREASASDAPWHQEPALFGADDNQGNSESNSNNDSESNNEFGQLRIPITSNAYGSDSGSISEEGDDHGNDHGGEHHQE